MCKIEVELSVEWHPEGCGNKNDQVVRARGGVIIRHEGDSESKSDSEKKSLLSDFTFSLHSNVHREPPKKYTEQHLGVKENQFYCFFIKELTKK